ncbi:hypothetical protein Ciccas_000709 [Cichlidogyrus casuarinus]|uniref:AAA+ ATPase domain-containing protein n=1 Tax=Cichlidogyrus casuarinus TaxID=1844966 RepID=A0ABD2QQ28_9PLAT
MEVPWSEKYRPSELDQIIGHADIRKTISKFLSLDKLPHLLFYGPAGTGKTTTILSIARQLYKPQEFKAMVLELNASDDRGIGVVRDQILSFAGTRCLFSNKFKLVILDEADSMTKDAQNALRRIIEKYSETTRFCLICNYLSKITPAIQSRCTRFRFAPLPLKSVEPRINEIATKEDVTLGEKAVQALFKFANGDMRKALNLLQSCSLSSPQVTVDSVYACVGYPSPEQMRQVLTICLNDDLAIAVEKLRNLQVEKGVSLQDMITELTTLVMKGRSCFNKFECLADLPEPVQGTIITDMAEIEASLALGATEKLQLGSLVATFTLARDSLKTYA